MRWTGTEFSDELLAMYRVAHASSWAAFSGAMESFGVPGQNCLYADVGGNIGFQTAGLIPVRQNGSPVLPHDGSAGEGAWRSFIPYRELPSDLNPTEGFIATANNRIEKHYPYHISSLWESESRITRILQLLGEQKRFSSDDFRVMQMDVLSPYAGSVRDAIVEAVRSLPRRNVELTRAMNRLARWDLRMNPSSVEASIFNSAWVHLVRNTLRDEMDSVLFDNYVFLSNLPTRIIPKLLADTSTTWFDDVRTPRIETRREILVRSLADALAELHTHFGPDISTWRWGALHTVEFRHPLGEIRPLGQLLNVGPISIGGNNTTVNNGEYMITDPYAATIGPSMRFVADMAVPDTAYFILPAGQSGQPLSPHYADQTAMWQIGAFHPLLMNVETVRHAGWKHLVLTPGP
jgi:penicillin amidase